MDQLDLLCLQDTGPNATRLYLLGSQQSLMSGQMQAVPWASRAVSGVWVTLRAENSAGNSEHLTQPREALAGEKRVSCRTDSRSWVPGKTPKAEN